MNTARRLMLTGPAGLVTLMLFHLMQSLISVDFVPNSDPAIKISELVRVRVESKPPPPRAARPNRPIVQSAPPPPGPPSEGEGRGPAEFTIARTIDPIDAGERTGPLLAVADGEAMPLVRVAPQYPQRAMQARREGRVLVELTIGRSGAVERARVVAAEPEGVFEEAALEAVSQWKYSPRIENGVAVSQPGVRTTIVFELREDRS